VTFASRCPVTTFTVLFAAHQPYSDHSGTLTRTTYSGT
jgi:hypothetical protein